MTHFTNKPTHIYHIIFSRQFSVHLQFDLTVSYRKTASLIYITKSTYNPTHDGATQRGIYVYIRVFRNISLLRNIRQPNNTACNVIRTDKSTIHRNIAEFFP